MAKLAPPVEIKPAQGGRLMGGLSAESAGLQNYSTKREWRRYMERELRAEGYEGLVLDQSVTHSIQITPQGSSGPITMIASARRGDGKRVIVAGNPSTLWAYTATEDSHYVLDVDGTADYFLNDGGAYVDQTQYGWIVIASGLSANGNRWEAVQVGDYVCLNNGVDLPLTYRPGDMRAYPIYELREQQIANVLTIANHNGNLLVSNLNVINTSPFLALMSATVSAVPASMNASGVVSVVSGTLFPGTTVTVGLTMFWATGEAATITSVAGGVITTDGVQAVPLGSVSLENPAQYAAFTDTTKMQRFPWRVLPSYPGEPRRFGATVPVSAAAGDFRLMFQYPIRSLPDLLWHDIAGGFSVSSNIGGPLDVVVLFAGLAGATQTTSIIGARNNITMSALIFNAVQSPVSFSGDSVSSMEAADAANSYAGTYADLVDDGGAIIKALQLRDQIVIYKETPVIFLGTFTGDLTTPYQWQRVSLANESQSLSYRNVVLASGGGFYGSCHIYAGRDAFYKFDLFMQTPTEIPELQAAYDMFFSAAVSDKENAYAAENPLTKEWVFGWSGIGTNGTPDRALCYGYESKTARTTSAPMSAASRIQHPNPARKDWIFVFGSDAGTVQRYGMWDAPVEQPTGVTVEIVGSTATASTAYFTPDHVGKSILIPTGDILAITGYTSSTVVTVLGATDDTSVEVNFVILPATWHRNGASYDSVLETGLGDLGAADSEKLVNRYVPIASSRLQWQHVKLPPFPTTLDIDFKAATNPTDNPTFIQSLSCTQPHNLTQPTFLGYYVGGRITITGINNPFALASQIWQYQPIGSKSAGRL